MPQSVQQLPRACTLLHSTMLGHWLSTARQSRIACHRGHCMACCPLFGLPLIWQCAGRQGRCLTNMEHAEHLVQPAAPHTLHMQGLRERAAKKACERWGPGALLHPAKNRHCSSSWCTDTCRRSCRAASKRAASLPDSSSARSSSPSWSWSRYSKICLKRLAFNLAMRFCRAASRAFDSAVMVCKARPQALAFVQHKKESRGAQPALQPLSLWNSDVTGLSMHICCIACDVASTRGGPTI